MSPLDDSVAYYRMSTDEQETSIEQQREEVEKYAAKHGYKILREYVDEGISGDETEKRKGFLKMLADAQAIGDYQVVLCWDQDRFGRFDSIDHGYYVKPLRDIGVRLETVAQGKIDWNTFSGRIIDTVQQEGKHAFLRDLSRNVTRGMLNKAKQGVWLGGPVPYAYDVLDQRLVPGSQERVEVVRWLFRTYATTTTSLGELARQLNERGVPSPGGKRWGKTAIHKILTRPAYCGDTAWNRRGEGRYHEVVDGELRAKKTKRRKGPWANPTDNWIITKDTHEHLIDRATFERVQQRLVENRELKTPVKDRTAGAFLFTRLVFCGDCGWPMHGCTNVQTKRKTRTGKPCEPRTYSYRRYICGNYNAYGAVGCRCNTITERQLVQAVAGRIRRDFLHPDNLNLLREELRRQLMPQQDGETGNAKDLRKQLADLEHKIDQGAERLLTAPANLTATLTAKLQEWQEQRDKVRADLNRAETAKPTMRPEVTIEAAMGQLDKLGEMLADLEDTTTLREAIRQMVSKIECWFDQVPYGTKRHRSVLRRGIIRLRPDVLVVRPDLEQSRDVPRARPLTTV
jgi:site-specific DNA recombinase